MVDGRPLFLDLEADSYFLLDANAEAKFLDDPGSFAIEAKPPIPVQSILDLAETQSAPVTWDILVVANMVRRVRTAVNRQPLARLVGDLAQSAAGGEARQDDAHLLAGRFARARRWIPVEPHCLHDSLALLSFLRRYCSQATLIFGAKRHPFAAHCWVQRGTLLLNDRLDSIASFTPVHIVGG